MSQFSKWTSILNKIALQCEQETIQRRFSSTISGSKRAELIKFVQECDIADLKGSTELANFVDAFENMVSRGQKKLNSLMFDLVLHLGVALRSLVSDQFWFCLINSDDYGRLFDQPSAVSLLMEEMANNGPDSWKAAFLLCILTYEYPNVKAFVVIELSQFIKPLSLILKDINHYALVCYIVELISQLENKDLIKKIADQDSEEFPENAYANDSQSIKFFKQHSVLCSNIVNFKSFAINKNLVMSGAGTCQFTENSVVILGEINEFATPFQVAYSVIKSVNSRNNALYFSLTSPPKHAMVADIRFPAHIEVEIEFFTDTDLQIYYNVVAAATTVATAIPGPRKISTAENFISLNGFYEDTIAEFQSNELPQNHEEEQVGFLHIEKSPPVIEVVATPVGTSTMTEEDTRSDSAENHETRDTSYSSKKVSRTASRIVAESTRVPKGSSYKKQDHLFPEASQQFIIESSQPGPTKDPQKFQGAQKAHPKEPKDPVHLADVWDLMSSVGVENDTSVTRTKGKALKCLDDKRADKRVNNKLGNLQLKSYPIVDPKDKGEKANSIVLSSVDNRDASFSGLTSPILHAQARATSRLSQARQKDSCNTEAPQNSRSKKRASHGFETPTTKKSKNSASFEVSTPRKPQSHDNSKKTDNKRKVSSLLEVFGSLEEDSYPIEEKDDPDFVGTEADVILALSQGPRTRSSKNRKTEKIQKSILQAKRSNITRRTRPVIQNDYEEDDDNKDEDHQRQDKTVAAAPTLAADLSETYSHISPISADQLLSEAYTTTLQTQIFNSITSFSNQLVKKIQLINQEINNKVMVELTKKYETLFGDLKNSFQNDVDDITQFIGDVKGLLNLSEEELVKHIEGKKLGIRGDGTK